MCKPSELKRGRELIESPSNPVHSCLIHNEDPNDKNVVFLTTSLKRAILEVVVSGLAKNLEDTINYMKCTFLYAELSTGNNTTDSLLKIRDSVESCIQYLVQNEFIEKIEDNGQFSPTQLGLAALSSALPPDEALAIFADLQNAQRNFVLDTDLHLLYLVTPYSCGDTTWIDWTLFYEKFSSFSKSFKRVAEIVSVNEAFLASAAHRGTAKMEKTTNKNDLRQIALHKRFFAALTLYDLINEKPVYQVAQMYGCNRGFLQSLQQQSATYAGMLVQFCDRLGWYHLKVLLMGFAERIAFGIRRELTELVQIDGIDGSRARAFHSCGLSTISNLVQCDINEIINVLRKAVPFQSGKGNLKKHSWLAGHPDLSENEAAQLVLDRAKKIFNEKLHQFGISVPLQLNVMENKLALKVNNISVKSNSTPEEAIAVNATSKEDNVEKVEASKKRINETGPLINENEIFNDSWFNLSPIIQCAADLKVKKKMSITEMNADCKTSTSTPNAKFSSVENVSKKSLHNTAIIDDEDILTCNLSRISISKRVELKNLPVSMTDDEILKFLNSQDNNCSPRRKNGENRKSSQSSTPILFGDDNDNDKGENDGGGAEPESHQYKLDLSKENLCSQDMFTPAAPAVNMICKTKRGRDPQSTPVLHIRKRSRTKNRTTFTPNNERNCDEKLIFVDLNKNHVDSFNNVFNKLNDANYVSICVRVTESLLNEKTVSFVFCLSESLIYSFDVNEKRLLESMDCLRSIFSCKSTTFVVYDVKEFLRLCLNNNIEIFSSSRDCNNLFCIRTACWLLNQDFSKLDLPSLANTLIGDQPCLYSAKYNSGSAEGDALLCYTLYKKIHNSILSNKLENVFSNIESKILLPVLKMELTGVRFDVGKCDSLIAKLKTIMNQIEIRCYSFAKKRFSLASHREVARVLFVDLGLPPVDLNDINNNKQQKTSYKHYSTKRENLNKLSDYHVMPSLISIWRRLHHALTCYVLPFRKRAKRVDRDGSIWKIFGHYDHLTATGRLIMSEPSLQTFPKRFILENVDNLTVDEEVINLRSLIIPSYGHIFLAADYSQLELRILAHFSKDDKLLSILNTIDGDVFKLIASIWKNISIEKVTPEQRQHAKQICYGIIYGIGVKSLSIELGVSENDAQDFIDSFNVQYKDVHKWIVSTIDLCRKNGYASTITGRRRYLNFIRCGTSSEKSQAERQAINTTIQGSAADLFKTAFIRVDEKFKQLFNGYRMTGKHYEMPKIVLQMHDELVVEIRENMLNEVQSIMKHEMETCFNLLVKLPVKFKAGPTWGDLTDIRT